MRDRLSFTPVRPNLGALTMFDRIIVALRSHLLQQIMFGRTEESVVLKYLKFLVDCS